MKTAEATTFRPTEPTDRPDPRVWRRVPGVSRTAYALGSLAVVEETTGARLEANQRWSFRVIKFGSTKSGNSFKRDDAMRLAEFALGIGECAVAPTQLPKNSL